MRKPIPSLIAISAVCFPLAANAAGVMKQGLWEMTINSGAGAAAQIPPEKLEELRKRGITIPQAGPMVTRMCVSKEMAERDQPPAMNRAGAPGECQPKNPQRSGNTFTSEMVCSGPNLQGQGLTKVVYSGDGFTSVTDFKGTAHGHPVNTHSESSGRWLGADCGSVQPPAMPK